MTEQQIFTCNHKNGCDRLAINESEFCIFHCINSIDYLDSYFEVLTPFYTALTEEILNQIRPQIIKNGAGTLLRDTLNNHNPKNKLELSDNKLIQHLKKTKVTLKNIHFPNDDKFENFNNLKLLLNIGSIKFKNCKFYAKNISFSKLFYYEKCTFENEVIYESFSNEVDSSFQFNECTFNKDVLIQSSSESNEINHKLFASCNFESQLLIKEIILNDTFIELPQVLKYRENQPVGSGTINNHSETQEFHENCFRFKSIKIYECTFQKPFKLNGLSSKEIEKLEKLRYYSNQKKVQLGTLQIEDSKFESKFECKNTKIEELKFIDTNVTKVFDAFGSELKQARFEKNIFKDFVGFEQVEFGEKDNYQDKFITKFIYSTFKDFSNFRQAKFYSGLDFERVNLKQLPNFLHAEVSQENTKRETFRIIKHSFDFVGNKIEANRFFAQEMITYKNELKENTKYITFLKFINIPTNKDWWIFKLNELISDFGNNYMRPISFLFVTIYLYTVLSFDSFNLKIPVNSSILDYILFLIVLFFILRKISTRITKFDFKVYFFLFIFYIWYFTTIFFLANSPLYISEFIAYILNSMVENLAILKIFKDKKTFIDLIYFLICSILIWQTVVSIKRKVQR